MNAHLAALARASLDLAVLAINVVAELIPMSWPGSLDFAVPAVTSRPFRRALTSTRRR